MPLKILRSKLMVGTAANTCPCKYAPGLPPVGSIWSNLSGLFVRCQFPSLLPLLKVSMKLPDAPDTESNRIRGRDCRRRTERYPSLRLPPQFPRIVHKHIAILSAKEDELAQSFVIGHTGAFARCR